MKKVICVLGLILCLLAVSVTVFADDTDAHAGLIPVNETVYYNPQNGLYVVPLTGGAQISASVADGMMTTLPVKILLPSGVSAQLYRNGQQITDVNWNSVMEPGSYVLSVYDNTTQSVEPLTFTVLNATTGAASKYSLPDGFIFTQVLRDDEEISFTDRHADLTQEGHYKLTYQCLATSLGSSMEVTVDHTAPMLKLEGVVDGIAKGPVDISDLEPDAKIRITLDKKEIKYERELKTSGHYAIWLEDSAGNTAEYAFELQVYFNFSSILLVLLLAGVGVLILAYLLYARKRARIR